MADPIARPAALRRPASDNPAHPARTPTGVPLHVDDATLQAWLDDDLGPQRRDVTSQSLFPEGHQGAACILPREALIVSGLEEAVRLFGLVGVQATAHSHDGARVEADTALVDLTGPTNAILIAERTALNLLSHLSGIATLTHETQKLIEQTNPDCRVSATRKTTPGLRALEKRAVLHGGGDPHRYGLYDMILIKDNHRAAGDGLDRLILRARDLNPGLPLEVEVESLEDAETAARAGADWILVDNQDPATLGRIANRARALKPDILIEASGGIRPETAWRWAPHADRVSLGALTMAAPGKDLSLEWRRPHNNG